MYFAMAKYYILLLSILLRWMLTTTNFTSFKFFSRTRIPTALYYGTDGEEVLKNILLNYLYYLKYILYIVGSTGQSKRTDGIKKAEAIGLFEKKYAKIKYFFCSFYL